MATRSRRYESSKNNDEGEEERRPRRSPKKSGPPLALIFGIVALMGGAVVLARMAANRPKEAAPVPEAKAEDIFGNLPVELPPERKSDPNFRKLRDTAPQGLANTAIWVEAKKVAANADAVYAEAKKAKAANDHTAWAEKGTRAKKLYDKALTMSAIWEEGLLEKYGDTDRQVAGIQTIRNKWFDRLAVLHKTTGR